MNRLLGATSVLIATLCGTMMHYSAVDMQQQVADLQNDVAIYQSIESSLQAEITGLNAALQSKELIPDGITIIDAGYFTCSAYCLESYDHICGGGTGITSSGTTATAGRTVATDPDVIPTGTVLYIEGIGIRIAEDTGSAIIGNMIDLAVETHDEALAYGVQTCRVYIIGEEG